MPSDAEACAEFRRDENNLPAISARAAASVRPRTRVVIGRENQGATTIRTVQVGTPATPQARATGKCVRLLLP